MDEQELLMYGVVALATESLSDEELAILNICAQTNRDPRGRLGSAKYLHLFDTERNDIPHMADETKGALARVVLNRLS